MPGPTKEAPIRDIYQIYQLEKQIHSCNLRVTSLEHFLNQQSILQETLTSIISEISTDTELKSMLKKHTEKPTRS